jgi:hypothetical protein
MNRIYKSPEGERLVRERYLAFLKHWPVAHQQIRIPTSQGQTFAIASGAEDAPPLLFHGGSREQWSRASFWSLLAQPFPDELISAHRRIVGLSSNSRCCRPWLPSSTDRAIASQSPLAGLHRDDADSVRWQHERANLRGHP